MSQQNRRGFLKSSAVFGATFAIAGTRSTGRVLGANETLRIAVAGLNGRGGSHVDEFTRMPGVQVTCLVDPDRRTWEGRVAEVKKQGQNTPKTLQDIRQALDDKEIDAVSIATPNHWHSLMTIWACQAGKDVYVEKPCSHNLHEGRVAVEAARKFNRVVQHGTQGRSSNHWARMAQLVRSGKYGKLLVSRGLCYKPRPSIGTRPDAPVPAELDYDIWTGPADQAPFNGNYVHYNWHWFWNFGNGDIGNQGVHQMDIARWMIPDARLPVQVVSLGGRFGYEDQGQTPNTQVALMAFGADQPMLVFEVRGLKTGAYHGEKVGNVLHFEQGIVAGDRFYPKGKDEKSSEPVGELPPAERGPGSGNHFANFVAAVRSRSTSDLNADILEGHYSSALCHLANASFRLGQPVPLGSVEKTLASCDVSCETVARMKEHLAQDNNLTIDNLTCTLGRTLAFDPATERFADDEANRLLTRPYRPSFTVPEKI